MSDSFDSDLVASRILSRNENASAGITTRLSRINVTNRREADASFRTTNSQFLKLIGRGFLRRGGVPARVRAIYPEAYKSPCYGRLEGRGRGEVQPPRARSALVVTLESQRAERCR